MDQSSVVNSPGDSVWLGWVGAGTFIAIGFLAAVILLVCALLVDRCERRHVQRYAAGEDVEPP